MSDSPRITAENWSDDLHWSFQHMDSVFPHDVIADDPTRRQVLAEAPQQLGAIPVALSDRTSSVEEILAETDTDGWMVLHHDRIIAEGYFGGMGPHSRHLLMSVSKSIVSAVVGVLVAQGKLDLTRTVADYIPELADAGYGSASIRDLLDMRSGIRFSEEYLDYDSEVRLLDEVAGWAPLRPGGPTTLKELLASLVQQREHGSQFEYRSSETDMLGWVGEAVSGQKFAKLASEVLWTRLGTRRDALLLLDREGTGLFDGGICATIGDLALFGAMIRDRGRTLTGELILNPEWVDDIFTGSPDSAEVYAASDPSRANSGGMYRSKFWFLDGRRDVACCLGIHGQMIYINRASGLVGVKTSAWPLPLDPEKADATLAMFDAISDHVGH
ncbi:serine hydrolase domain-containing protein [Streptosporangium sandarakinum]|uniref:serine hydrolase domain-containing protein n=1 Tax=Streptosporangium sandarakinum TaxID=1260955 RepID=UPI0037B0CC23